MRAWIVALALVVTAVALVLFGLPLAIGLGELDRPDRLSRAAP